MNYRIINGKSIFNRLYIKGGVHSMVFGFGKGKIEVQLENYNLSPGDMIKGTVLLQLKKPVHARALKVLFIGEAVTRRTTPHGGGVSTSYQKTYVHKFEMPLDGEKDYSEGTYNFEIAIPKDILQRAGSMPMEGTIGDLVKAAQILTGTSKRINWYVEAKLDVPKGLDIRKKVQVNIV